MIFKQWQQVLDGTKTQTRRLVKPNHHADPEPVSTVWEDCPTIWRIKWQVGKTYAVQPGRGKKAIGRIRIKEIRRERLQEIGIKDLQAEMGQPGVGFALVFFFIELWDGSYRHPYRWECDPEVWVLEFERVPPGVSGA